MTGISENAFINTKNQSYSITAEVVAPKEGAEGVLLAQGGRFGGWSLYIKDDKPIYTYNWLGRNIAACHPAEDRGARGDHWCPQWHDGVGNGVRARRVLRQLQLE